MFEPLARIDSIGPYVPWLESINQVAKLIIRRVPRVWKGDDARQVLAGSAVSGQNGPALSYLRFRLVDQVVQEAEECSFVICARRKQFQAYLYLGAGRERLEG